MVNLSHLIREDGSVVVPARVAGPMLRVLTRGLLDVQRRSGGGQLSADVLDVLEALQLAQIRESDGAGSGSGTIGGDVGTVEAGGGPLLTSSEAAALLQCTERAIRKACAGGRLPATRAGKAWLIRPHDLEHFRFRRSAA